MIKVEYDQRTLAHIERKLGSMKSQAPKVLKTAINETAKQSRTLLAKQARQTYTVKSAKFKSAIKPTYATTASLEAVLRVSGKPQKLTYFQYRKNSQKVGAKARGRNDRPLKELVSTRGGKAFIASFQSTHNEVTQREGKARLPLKTFYGPSDPQMIGGKAVYGTIKGQIEEKLKKNVERQIRRVLGGN